MKHIKHHPLNDKSQGLSKDMKKQDLVRPKKDKKLEADDSLSDPKVTKRISKPSNKKLSSEKHLSSDGKVKKVEENQLNNIFSFDDFINEELTKTPATYEFTKNKKEDTDHDKLASKEKDGHKWKKSVKKKFGKESISQKYTCDCGYGKDVINDENKNITVKYSKK